MLKIQYFLILSVLIVSIDVNKENLSLQRFYNRLNN